MCSESRALGPGNKHKAIEVLEDLRAHYEHLARQWGVAHDGSLSFNQQQGIRCGYLWEVEALRIAIVALKVQDRRKHEAQAPIFEVPAGFGTSPLSENG